jgi:hypothetical protein
MFILFLIGVLAALFMLRFRARLRHPLVAAGAIILAVLAMPSLAFAASDEPPTPATGTEVEQTTFNLPASTVLYVTAVIIPIVGGLLIRYIKSGNGKAAVMIVLNGLNALFVTATTADGDAIFSASLVNNFIISTVIAIAMLYGFYKQAEVGGQTIDAKLKGAPAVNG